jgi:hypothetical protein
VINTEIVIIIWSFKMTGRLSTNHLKKEVEQDYEGTVDPPSFACAHKIWAEGRNSETTRENGLGSKLSYTLSFIF